MRDEFPLGTKDLLSKRVGNRCSNPNCRQLTSGPQEDPNKALNVGVAAHITAASPEGPRYDIAINSEDRKSAINGIWLCQKCAKLIDNDQSRYTNEVLIRWKTLAEKAALDEVEGKGQFIASQRNNDPHQKVEKLLPDLIVEMKKDLSEQPLKREFVLLEKRWLYWANGNEFIYYFEDHPDLKSKIRILENYGLVNDISFNKVDRYNITEDFADYLTHMKVPRVSLMTEQETVTPLVDIELALVGASPEFAQYEVQFSYDIILHNKSNAAISNIHVLRTIISDKNNQKIAIHQSSPKLKTFQKTINTLGSGESTKIYREYSGSYEFMKMTVTYKDQYDKLFRSIFEGDRDGLRLITKERSDKLNQKIGEP